MYNLYGLEAGIEKLLSSHTNNQDAIDQKARFDAVGQFTNIEIREE